MTGEPDEEGDPGVADRWRFEAVFHDPVSFIAELAPDGTVRRVNPTALAFVEAAPANVVGRHFAETPWWRHSERERERLRERIGRAASGEFVRFTAENVGDGEARAWLDVSLLPVTDEDGEVVTVIAQGRDITERVRAQAELESRTARMRALHDAAVDLESAATEDAACERAVAAAEDVLDMYLCYVGLVEDDHIVPRARSSRATDDHVRAMRTDQGLAGRTLQTGESQLVGEVSSDGAADPAKEDYRSGLSVPVGDLGVFQAVSTEPEGFDDADLELAETLAAHLAVTLRRIRTEAQLRRQNERLDRFASVVAHDLRNPLAVVSGSLDLALDSGDPADVERAVAAADRMEELVDDLLDLARAGASVGETERVALDALAERAWRNVDHGDATLSVAVDAHVEVDPARVQQLFENLFRNSVEHGSTGNRAEPDDSVEHAGDHASVTVGRLDDDTGFFVADDGPGIPAEKREQVFAHGYSSDGGTGFGLAIVRDIAEAHGWTVDVAESETGGARFEVRGVALD